MNPVEMIEDWLQEDIKLFKQDNLARTGKDNAELWEKQMRTAANNYAADVTQRDAPLHRAVWTAYSAGYASGFADGRIKTLEQTGHGDIADKIREKTGE